MDEKNNKFTKIDELVQKDYPFVGAIGTYLNIEPDDKVKASICTLDLKKKMTGSH